MKRGRPPIHRKAMTPAQRQARRRKKLKKLAEEEKRAPYPAPHGYGRAKQQLITQGHVFERARREFGFEEDMFVDDALMEAAHDVIALAEMPRQERLQRIAKARLATKTSLAAPWRGT